MYLPGSGDRNGKYARRRAKNETPIVKKMSGIDKSDNTKNANDIHSNETKPMVIASRDMRCLKMNIQFKIYTHRVAFCNIYTAWKLRQKESERENIKHNIGNSSARRNLNSFVSSLFSAYISATKSTK